jgi:hypothetical protein
MRLGRQRCGQAMFVLDTSSTLNILDSAADREGRGGSLSDAQIGGNGSAGMTRTLSSLSAHRRLIVKIYALDA